MSTTPFNIANNWNFITRQISNNPGANLVIDASGNNNIISLTKQGNTLIQISGNTCIFSRGVIANNSAANINSLIINNSVNVSPSYHQLIIQNTGTALSTRFNSFCNSNSGYSTNNGIIQSNDSGILYTSNNNGVTTSNSGFVLFPNINNSLIQSGLRMDPSGNVNIPLRLNATQFSNFTSPKVQVLTSGSGTYTTPTNPSPLYLYIKIVGGGGGGGGGGPYNAADPYKGGTGGTTTFGSFITCNGGGGAGGVSAVQGGGGAASVTTSASIIKIFSFNGTSGSGGLVNFYNQTPGCTGAASPFGGAGGGGITTGGIATGYGSGGGGGGFTSGNYPGGGGGSAGYAEVLITSPLSSYSYAVGNAGTGGASSIGYTGGAGGSGAIIVTAYFQ